MGVVNTLISKEEVISNSLAVLNSLRHNNGLFSAALNADTGYNRFWIRDNVYAALGLENYDLNSTIIVYHRILDLLLKHEYKIDFALNEKPAHGWQFIHPLYNNDLSEIAEEWGWKQNDAVGTFLFAVGRLENKGIRVLRDVNDFMIMQKLVFYLQSIEYWHCRDNGIWEEYEELHASSVGACVAGLKAVKNLVYVPEELILKGEEMLNVLLPRESVTKEVDLALLSLIYPYNVVNEAQRDMILRNVEAFLVREKGVIRYICDKYYGNEYGEAEWSFGFPWLAIIYKQIGDEEKHNFYINKTLEALNHNFEMPELYYANSNEHNENVPLAWGQAMVLAALK